MPYKRKHPALREKTCEQCGVSFVVTSSQLAKKRCGSFKNKTGCAAEIGRLAQKRYRKKHPEYATQQTQVFNNQREIERAQARVKKYVSRYGLKVINYWIKNSV